MKVRWWTRNETLRWNVNTVRFQWHKQIWTCPWFAETLAADILYSWIGWISLKVCAAVCDTPWYDFIRLESCHSCNYFIFGTHNQGVNSRNMLLTLQSTGTCAYVTGDVSLPRSWKFYLVQLEGRNTAVWEKLRRHRRPRYCVLCWDCKEQFSINLYCSCWS